MATQSKISTADLVALDARELLALRFCDIDWSGPLPARYAREVKRFRLECAAKEISFVPKIYFAREWLCPERSVAIGIPFYLSHPKLKRLERELKKSVEGESAEDFGRLLRHEMGHCFDHAFGVSRRRDFYAIFGSPRREYAPDFFIPDPLSRDHVQHLPGHYAQAHPLEDFAETFAVCLDSRSQWQKVYRGRPRVLNKLHYVESLLRRHAGQSRLHSAGLMMEAQRSVLTLQAHYKRQLALMAKIRHYVNLNR